MKNTAESPSRSPASRWRKRLFSMLFTTGVGSFIRSQLPDGGYPTDLSQIDGERPAPVLAHDAIYTGGMAAMDLLSEFRHDYAGR